MFTATAIGRLVKDPVLETTPKGTPVTKFRIACDKPRGRTGANYIDIVVWAGAEDNAKHLTKGRQVAVTGTVDHQQWRTGETYHERYELVADEVIWLARAANDTATEESAPATNSPDDEAF